MKKKIFYIFKNFFSLKSFGVIFFYEKNNAHPRNKYQYF